MYEGATVSKHFYKTDKLKSFEIERVGESKFFGFGICSKANIKLIDTKRELNVTTANSFRCAFGYKNGTTTSYPQLFPKFYVTEVHRDENTNELSITAYDAIYSASKHTVSELTLTTPYTINDFALACTNLLGMSGLVLPTDANSFNTSYESGANFDGTETIREALNAVAGKQLTNSGMEHMIKKRCKGVEGYRNSPHTFRHTFAQMSLKQGRDLYSLSRQLGHEDLQTTSIYLRSLQDEDMIQISKNFVTYYCKNKSPTLIGRGYFLHIH